MSDIPLPDQKALGFQGDGCFSWDAYIKHRPAYPPSLWNHIYQHHAARPGNAFHVAHDVGAGPGNVAEKLAEKFDRVIVSEPNAEYFQTANSYLSSLPFAVGKFHFFQESAEESSVPDGTVDLVTIFEAIHWTNISIAISESARQLKIGGTLCIILYSPACILGDDKAHEIWKSIWHETTSPMFASNTPQGKSLMRIGSNLATAMDHIKFSEDVWEVGTERVYTNMGGSTDAILSMFTDLKFEKKQDQFGIGEKRVWREEDTDWMTREVNTEWLEGSLVSFIPGVTFEKGDVRWKALAEQLESHGGKLDVKWPNVQIIATKK